jgi:hypothetical protein
MFLLEETLKFVTGLFFGLVSAFINGFQLALKARHGLAQGAEAQLQALDWQTVII